MATLCSCYEELSYNITLFDKVPQLLTIKSTECFEECNVTFSLSGPGDYQFQLQAVNNRGTSDLVTRNFTISGKTQIAAQGSMWEQTINKVVHAIFVYKCS